MAGTLRLWRARFWKIPPRLLLTRIKAASHPAEVDERPPKNDPSEKVASNRILVSSTEVDRTVSPGVPCSISWRERLSVSCAASGSARGSISHCRLPPSLDH